MPTVVLVLVGLFAGIGAAILVPRLLDGDEGGDSAPAADGGRTLGDEEIDGPADLLPDDAEVPPGAGADSPEAALTGFLDAEVAGDYESSFGYLSAEDRTLYGSPAGWVASHADAIPPVLAYELEPVDAGDGQATAVSTVTFEPGLDQVVGLTPGRAQVTWDLRQGADGSWGVSMGETTTFEPLYPSEEGVGPAAQRWVTSRQACETPSNEFGGLIGPDALADALCGADGELELGEPAPLGDIEEATYSTAFGPETAQVVRVVRVSGPVELGVALAPIGDEWTVIGVVP